MKKYLMIAVAATLMSFASIAQAQEQQTEATVTKVTGSATFKVGSGAAQTLAAGTKIPQGAEITTQAKSQVTLQAHDGIVAIAGANTTVQLEKLSVSANGMRNATLALKSGNVASSLDPKRKDQNNYSVRTPKGALECYTDDIGDFAMSPYDNISMKSALAVLSSNSSKPADLLSKQLIAAEYNYQNKAYLDGNATTTFLFLFWGEYVLKNASSYSSSSILFVKDWFDAYNNSHGGVVAGPLP